MTPEPSQLNKPLKFALQYADAGYLVFPCKPGTKVPATPHGLKDATADPAQVRKLFWNPRFNIGLCCGPQPNGVNLLAVDVDAHKGGLDSWRSLTEQRPALGTAWHTTPSGGMHVFFDAPEGFRNTRERLGDGIDTRGEGGYVVVPPSRFPVGDEEKLYGATEEGWLLRCEPAELPSWLAELLSPAPKLPPSNHARDGWASEGETPGDWVRRTQDWSTVLQRHGWTHLRGDYWVRPGKDPREGHSAVLHEDGPLVVFTTDVPRELEALGKATVDGTGFAVSLFDVIAAYEFGGDRQLAGRSIRAMMPRPGEDNRLRTQAVRPGHSDGSNNSAGPSTGTDGGSFQEGPAPLFATSTVAGLNLPDEFWDERPILGQIRQAAQARLVSPDALLIAVLARHAALVPPTIKLPAVIGSEATFDFLGCIVAETSGGKSISVGVARDLVPDPQLSLHEEDRTIMLDRPIGSGEGVAQAFMVPEIKEDESGKSKATGRQVVGKQALHFSVDESTGLVAQSKREGTTIIQTLLSAWSGQTLGQQNARADTKRIIDGGRVRVSAVLNIQTSNAWMLFTDEMTTLGLTSRVLVASAHDPAAPDELPDWPGTLSWPLPPNILSGRTMTYVRSITEQIVEERRAVLRGGVSDKSTGHASLLRCKVAGLLALWEGRFDVSEDDWRLSGAIVGSSASLMNHLRNMRSQQLDDRRRASAEAQGEYDDIVETTRERKGIASMAEGIRRRVTEEPVTKRALARLVSASKTRHRFEAALELAEKNCWIVIEDDIVRGA